MKENAVAHNVRTRIKALEGEELTEEDLKIYCIWCGKEIKGWEFWIPFRIMHCMLGWGHRRCFEK